MSGKYDPESRYASLISLRKSTRTFITKKFNEKDCFDQLDVNQLRATLHNFKSRCDRLDSLNEEYLELVIQLKKPSEQELDEEVTKCEEYQDKAAACIALIQGLLTTPGTPDPSTPTVLAYQSRSFLKPPQTPLPSFEGKDIEDISRFLAEFEKAIQPYKYTDYDKFLLLKKQTIGKAGSLLGSLDGSKQTYRDAKTLLEQAFGDREIQKYNLLSKLTSLNLKTTESYELYSEFNSITASLDNLYVTAKDLYRFSLWKALPHAYQTQYLAYSTESVPEFDVLKKHYFDVCRRVQNSNTQTQEKEKNPSSLKHKSNKSSAVTLATGVKIPDEGAANPQSAKEQKYNKPYCSLCYRTGQAYSHKLGLCKTYPTTQDKVTKLKALGGCTKCTSLKHNTANCNYQGEKCRTCHGMHHNILCLSQRPSGGGTTSSQATNKLKQ